MFKKHENNYVLNENSVEGKPCINRESKSNELTIQLYIFHDINMKFLAVVTQPSIYHLITSIEAVLVPTLLRWVMFWPAIAIQVQWGSDFSGQNVHFFFKNQLLCSG